MSRVAGARAQLDEEAFEAAWAEGRAMTLEQAVEYALDHATTPDTAPQRPTPPGSAPGRPESCAWSQPG
jgi:hypothetical protein